jgi:hypothetical protein
MATVNKNFRIKNGLVVEGSTATVNGQNILTETGGDTYILNLVGGATLVKSVSSDFAVDVAGNLTINGSSDLARTGDITTAINNLDTDDIEEGSTNKYFTTARIDDHLSGTNGINYNEGQISLNYHTGLSLDVAGKVIVDRTTVDTWYDAAGAAATAQSNAEDYADGLAVNYDAAGSASAAQTAAENYADGLAVNYDAAGSASTAETNANNYTDTALENYTTTANLDTTIDGYGYLKSADLSGYATESYVGTAIDNLVDGAPGLLDTLNEIAAAINDDANYATTITTALSGKQGTLTASTGITIDGSNNISVTANTYDAYGAAATAQSNAEDYADGLASNYDAAGTAAGLVDDLKDATTAFTAINLNSVAKEVAATATIASAGSANAITWSASSYRTAKALVKFETDTHSQVSEVLLTLDAANNIAITEYAEVGTNGSLGTVSASFTSGTVAITVTTAQANTDVMVKATLLA